MTCGASSCFVIHPHAAYITPPLACQPCVAPALCCRYGFALMLLLTAPAIFCMSIITDASGFIALRLITGLSLSTFVSCQYWCYTMFSVRAVGTATAVAAGIGNAGERCGCGLVNVLGKTASAHLGYRYEILVLFHSN